MTEKREWWSDDLIAAVSDAMGSSAYHDEMVYAIIAAVEDHLNPVWESSSDLIRMQNDALKARDAAIQRVREIHQPHRCRMSTRHIDCSIMFGGGCSREGKCQVCREKYPCATICNLGRVHNGNG